MDSAKVVKTVILVTIAILFLVASIMSIVSASNIISETTKTYILEVERCEFKSIPRPVEAPNKEEFISEEKCKIDYNRAKEELAESAAVLIVSLPIAIFTYRRLFKIYKE